MSGTPSRTPDLDAIHRAEVALLACELSGDDLQAMLSAARRLAGCGSLVRIDQRRDHCSNLGPQLVQNRRQGP